MYFNVFIIDPNATATFLCTFRIPLRRFCYVMRVYFSEFCKEIPHSRIRYYRVHCYLKTSYFLNPITLGRTSKLYQTLMQKLLW